MYNRPRMPLPGETATDSNNAERVYSGLSIFAPISTDPPLDIFQRVNHPVGLPANMNKQGPIETNKFYGNMFLDDQTLPVWTHPYSVWKSKQFNGLATTQIPASKRVFGPGEPASYFYSPIGIQSMVLSAAEFSQSTQLGFSDVDSMSINVMLSNNANQSIIFPLVQGMGFVTGIYSNITPMICSQVGFSNVVGIASPRAGIDKYKFTLNDGSIWTMYITLPSGQSLGWSQVNGAMVANNAVSNCVIQLCVGDFPDFDWAAGCYPVSVELEAEVTETSAHYAFNYITNGSSVKGTTMMFACPHHFQNFTEVTSSTKTNTAFDSTSMGTMVGFLTNIFDFNIPIAAGLGFDPFTTIPGKTANFNNDAYKAAVANAAKMEVNGDIQNESNLDSMYFSGKILAKYAWILYVTKYILHDDDLSNVLLGKLQNAIARFTSNQQQLPLKYDTTWGGIISSGSESQDFGNAYYNDHHFHYAYHVIAAAIVGKVDRDMGGSWLNKNQQWVENLIRDFANPSSSDTFFPVSRSFDYFCGHSWAKGLFASGDGKDQESSSEDMNAAYALKLWGTVTGNTNLQKIGDLQLGILRTSIQNYFLYDQELNKTQPANFIGNFCSGILFENKIDHTTYFGNLVQYIQMIHAIPILAPSSFIRTPSFTQQEFNKVLAPIVEQVTDGWRGIIMLNVALFDPQQSFNFFTQPNFNMGFLDPGQSLTWSIAYSGAFI